MKRFYRKSTSSVRQLFLLFFFISFGFAAANAQTSTAEHFTTVWEGENGQNHMNFVVISAILDDLPLGAGDEIAVLSGSFCVGASTLQQAINSSVSSTFVSIKASESDGSNNGFIVNDTILFKIWDSKNQKELLAKAVKYRNDLSSWLTDGKFATGATAVVEIVGYTEYTQTIQLLKGTNFFSANVVPSNSNMGIVLKSLYDQGALIKVLDEAGNSFEYLNGAWINKIGSIAQTEGYSISVNVNTQFQITGKPVVLPLDIPLKKGWNFISYPRTDVANAMSVVQVLIDQKKLLKVQDEKGYTIEKVKGVWKNSIGNFIPGKGYKINMSSDAALTIQKSYTKSAVSVAEPEKTQFFDSNFTGNGSDHMNINWAWLAESGFSVGDELAAFDGNKCVGSLKLIADHFSKDLASLVVTSTDEINDIGFTSGNQIQIYRWNALTGNLSAVLPEILEGELKYEEYASILIKANKLATSVKDIHTSVDVEVFPNPASTRFTVRFQQLPEDGSTIEITDITGRKITGRKIDRILEEFNIGKQSPGTYLVKSILGSEIIIKKLIIN